MAILPMIWQLLFHTGSCLLVTSLPEVNKYSSSNASGGSLHGGVGFRAKKAHFAA